MNINIFDDMVLSGGINMTLIDSGYYKKCNFSGKEFLNK